MIILEVYIHLKLIKKTRKITIGNRLDLEMLGLWLIMPKILHEHHEPQFLVILILDFR